MLGYGELLLSAAQCSGFAVAEIRPASLMGGLSLSNRGPILRKFLNNVDRFALTPIQIFGTKVDIVHVVDPGNAVYLPLIKHRLSIVTVHDMIPYLARDGRIPGWKPSSTGRFLLSRIAATLATVDHVVCVSQSTMRDFLSYVSIPQERVSVIPNVAFNELGPASVDECAALRNNYGIPIDAPIVLHVGRGFYKDRRMVIDVFKRVHSTRSDTRLVLVGSLERDLLEQIADLGIRDAVHVIDAVAAEQMAALYTAASVLFFPSIYEGFGLPVLEARMCGTPVVCSDAGSLPEVVGTGCVMLPRHDTNGFLGAILEAISSSRRLPIFSRDFPNWVRSHASLYDQLSSRRLGRLRTL